MRRTTSKEETGPIRVVLYCRVSTKEQVKNLSLATQERECRRFCEHEGYDIVKVFREMGESAKTRDRTSLRELLTYCREHQTTIDHLVVYAVDRFSRDRVDYFMLGRQLGKLGVTLRSATQPIDEKSTGRLMEGILASFAQFDNDVRSERTTAGMKATLEEGRWPFLAPIGYRHIADARGRRTIEPAPSTAPHIKHAFELIAAGELSKKSVLGRITARGLLTTKRKRLTAQTFDKVLRNPIYAGWLYVPSWKTERVRGSFDAIVDEETFARVQVVLDGRGVQAANHARNHIDFPLRRFAKCARCGTPMTASWSKGRSARYAYYRCRNRVCRGVNVSKRKFEAQFLDYVSELRPKPEYVKLFREVVEDVWKKRRALARSEMEVLGARIRTFEDRRNQLLEAHVYQKTIADDLYRREDDRLSQEITLAKMELNDAQVEELDIEAILTFAEEIILDARRLWVEGDLEQRQRLQEVLFPEGVNYDSEAGFGTARTAIFFKWLEAIPAPKDRLASPTGVEPVLLP